MLEAIAVAGGMNAEAGSSNFNFSTRESRLTCLRRIHELAQQNSQFVIATHSPIILAYPDATIYSFDDDGLHEVDYEDAAPVRLTQSFLQARERFLRELLSD